MQIQDLISAAKLPAAQRLNLFLLSCFVVLVFLAKADRDRHFEDDIREREACVGEKENLRRQVEMLYEDNKQLRTELTNILIKTKVDADTLNKKMDRIIK